MLFILKNCNRYHIHIFQTNNGNSNPICHAICKIWNKYFTSSYTNVSIYITVKHFLNIVSKHIECYNSQDIFLVQKKNVAIIAPHTHRGRRARTAQGSQTASSRRCQCWSDASPTPSYTLIYHRHQRHSPPALNTPSGLRQTTHGKLHMGIVCFL